MSEKGNRTVQLVGVLTTKEQQQLAAKLEAGKRSSIYFLFSAICKGLRSSKSNGLEKSLLFRMTFDEPYSKDKDYLLRNEFRLLSKELVSFLSIEQTKKSFRDNSLMEKWLFLQGLSDRNAHDLFEKDWRKVADEAIAELEFQIALDILKMAIHQLVEHKPATPDNYHVLLELLDEYQSTLERFFLHEHLFAKHKQAFSQRTLQAIGFPTEITGLETIVIEPNGAENDALAAHLASLSRSYSVSGKEKIELLLKAADFADKVNAKKFDKNGSLATVNAAIALEYFLLQQFEDSLPYHLKALKFGKDLEGRKLISFVFNYLSTLIRLERYSEAVELIEKYEHVWSKLARVLDRFLCLKAMCLVFENDPNAAENCIPEDRKAGGLDHYYYYRFIQIIVLFQKEKSELAINETENFEHTVRYNDKDEDYLKLILVMKKFLSLKSEQTTISEDAYSEKSEKLKQSLSEVNENAFADRALLYRWIEQRL